MIVRSAARTPANDTQVAREVSSVRERRAAMASPPVTHAVSDAVAVGIAAVFRSPRTTGQVMDHFARTGSIDSEELGQAARFEQGDASPEGRAALYGLIGRARSRAHRGAQHSGVR